MGTVHAREGGQDMDTSDDGYILGKTKVKVQRVIFDGISKTKTDILEKAVKPVLSCENLMEVQLSILQAKDKLNKLGLFKSMEVILDTSKASSPLPNGYDVIFKVEEIKLPRGRIATEFGDNEGHLVGALQFFNIFGRGERFQTNVGFNLSTFEEYGCNFQKPLNGEPDVRLGTNLYKTITDFPWSSFKETCRGTSVNLMFPSRFGSHSLRWEGVWRNVTSLNKTTSFEVREQFGHSLKSSIQHLFIRDSRDDRILPTEGHLLKLTQEYAGIGGNVEFVKNNIELQYNLPLILDSVLQFSLGGGLLAKIDQNKEIRINDRFFLGGPLTLRGFKVNGVGPHSEGSALGADAYWISGVHLYTPLPFRPGKGGFGELFRSHFFVQAGNLGNINTNQTVKENLKNLSETLRLSYGLGVVLKLGGIARLEINYAVPLRFQNIDSIDKGFQFGVGLSFM